MLRYHAAAVRHTAIIRFCGGQGENCATRVEQRGGEAGARWKAGFVRYLFGWEFLDPF